MDSGFLIQIGLDLFWTSYSLVTSLTFFFFFSSVFSSFSSLISTSSPSFFSGSSSSSVISFSVVFSTNN